MYLFYNRSDSVIQGFGNIDFKTTGEGGFNQSLHKQYKGDFEIPNTVGEINQEEHVSIANQTVFNLTTFIYEINKNNIIIEKEITVEEDLIWEIISFEDYVETNEDIITFNSGIDEGTKIKFNSQETIYYEFNEEANTFSQV